MPQSTEFRVRTVSGFRAWLMIVLAAAILLAVLGAVAVLTIGILLFLLPVLVLAAVFSYAFMWLRRGNRGRANSRLPVVLEGEYRVLDPGDNGPRAGTDDSHHR